MKNKLSNLELAIDGKITPEQAVKIRLIKQHYEVVLTCKKNLQREIMTFAEPYNREKEIIQTAPGCSNPFTAVKILSEIGGYVSIPFYWAPLLLGRPHPNQ